MARIPTAQTSSRTNPLAAVPPPESWRWHLAVFLGYLALGVVWTWPLVLHFTSAVIQVYPIPGDAGQGIWSLWWTRHALLNGQSPYVTRYLFYPQEIDLFWQTLSLPNGLLVLPILSAFGPVVGFNTLTLLSFGLGGYFTYLIARALLVNRVGALLAGFVFVASPYHMQQLHGGPMELIAIQWIPLYILALLWALYRQTIRSTLVASGTLIVVTLASQYYGLYCAIYTVAHGGLALLLANDWRQRRRYLVCALGIVGGWALTMLLFVQTLSAVDAYVPRDWYERQVFHSAALIDFAFPNVLHPLWGSHVTARLGDIHTFGVDTGVQLGLSVTALLVVALAAGFRKTWPWLALGVGMLVLALGPELKLAGDPTGVPLPFFLFDIAAPFRNSSRPGLFVALMMIPVSVLVGYGLQALGSYARQFRTAVTSVAVLAVAFELLALPLPLLEVRADPLYAQMNADPTSGAVLELPTAYDDSRAMLNQLCHGRPLVGGYLARTPINPLVSSAPELGWLRRMREPVPDIVSGDLARELSMLGIRFVTLHPERMTATEANEVRNQIAAGSPSIQPYAVTEQMEVYAVEMQDTPPLAFLGTGWYDPEYNEQRTWRWMNEQARLTLLAQSDAAVSLSFGAVAYQSPRALTLRFGETALATFDISPEREQFITVDFLLPAGQHDLVLQSDTSQATPEGRTVSVSVSQVRLSGTDVAATPDHTAPMSVPPVIPRLNGAPCW